MMLAAAEIAPDDKLDVSVRMNALRLAFELEMWEESIQIGHSSRKILNGFYMTTLC